MECKKIRCRVLKKNVLTRLFSSYPRITSHGFVAFNANRTVSTVLMALKLLIEGSSIRPTMRITGVDGNTITKALVLVGERC
jgi:hypothetical protein